MEFTTVTWNIGGGNLLKPGDDPSLLASYTVPGLDEIVARLVEADPDIITLQEAEGSAETNQVAYIASQLGRDYYFYDPTSGSHLDESQNLGNGIISKHPVSEHEAGIFHNPNIEFDLEGKTVTSHDKGYGQCLVDVNGRKIRTTSLHLLPFIRMGIALDSDVAKEIFESAAQELVSDDELILIQGDFNINDSKVGSYLHKLFSHNGLLEITIEQATTPKAQKYDHVLYKGLHLVGVEIDQTVKTDHYPVISRFQLAA